MRRGRGGAQVCRIGAHVIVVCTRFGFATGDCGVVPVMLEGTVVACVGEGDEAEDAKLSVWASDTGSEVQEGVAGALTFMASGY